MTNDEILQAAKEAGIPCEIGRPYEHKRTEFQRIERFADIIEKRTIERCAVVCDVEWNGDSDTYEYSIAANDLAAAIRELGEP